MEIFTKWLSSNTYIRFPVVLCTDSDVDDMIMQIDEQFKSLYQHCSYILYRYPIPPNSASLLCTKAKIGYLVQCQN